MSEMIDSWQEQNLPPPVEVGDTMSVRELSTIIIHSFAFARGFGNAQDEILKFQAHALRDRLDEATLLAAFDPTVKRAFQIASNSNAHPRDAFGVDPDIDKYDVARQEVEKYYIPFYNHVVYGSAKPNIRKLTNHLLVSDSLRHGSKGFYSNVIRYGLMDQTTGMPSYDDMFGAVASELPHYITRPRLLTAKLRPAEHFAWVLDAHLRNNPDDKPDLQPIIRYGLLGKYGLID